MLWQDKWFPGTNLQDLNLDWILKKISALRGGNTGQYLYKKSDKDFDFGWKTGSGGGGGTSDYIELDNKPSINNVELVGNKTASDLGLASASDIPVVPVQSVNSKTGAVVLSASDVGAYVKPETGIPKTDLSSAVRTSLDKADTAMQVCAKADEIAIIITGARPSMAATSGQFVIVRNSTISGISDGLYTANTALSPSADVTAADLTAAGSGGLNFFTGNPTNAYITSSVTTGEKISNLRVVVASVRGGLCQLYVGFDIGQAIVTNDLILTLPEGYRPKTSPDGLLALVGNGGVTRTVRLNNDGTITAAEPFTVSTYNRLVVMYYI